MSFKRTLLPLRHIYVSFAVVLCLASFSSSVVAQSVTKDAEIDPRLVEIIRLVKERTSNPIITEEITEAPSQDDIYLDLVDQMQSSFYSQDADKITQAVLKLEQVYIDGGALDLSRTSELYTTYVELLSANASSSSIQSAIADYTVTGNWFEKYTALSVAALIHANAKERQAALQKAQRALSLIPTKPNQQNEAYVTYAKAKIVALIAHLHNLQGNSELALVTSLDYLTLTEDNPDLKAGVDLINNLIFSYSMGRNHEAQLYLSEQLLEIEKAQSSNVPGLSEMRISGVMNSSGRFLEGLEYAERSLENVTHPTVSRLSQVNKAIALAGLGRREDARAIAAIAKVNFTPDHMLKSETRTADLYLAFLLAQTEDTQYATQLFNRQLDVKAQKFLANNSRDTTAMLAELENSRERQVEREAARARESALQAMTIDRQRKLNRTLIIISALMAMSALLALLFTRFREKILRKLEIKTREAASAEKLKSEFLGMISHELRTPLNGIIGISDYLANYHEDEDIRQKTSIVLQSGNELLGVVESLTVMARIDAGQLTLVPHDADLKSSLASVPGQWAEKAKAKGLTFTHYIDPSLSRHHIDEERLLQCLNILMANAISFTNSGRVHMHITATKSDPSELTVVVADTGRGMSELVQSRLFTPFMQADTSRKRNHMGTGLSLAIAYALVDLMDGTLSCVSREGRGSEFIFKIPLKDAVAEPVLEASEHIERQVEKVNEDSAISLDDRVESQTIEVTPTLSAPIIKQHHEPQREVVDLMQPSGTGRPALHAPKNPNLLETTPRAQRILIVDDIDSNRDILRLMLETKGHICSEASDGFTGLSALDRNRYDLVILDIHMAPMDGVEALRRLRACGKSYANIPVIALTADNAPQTNAECIEAGANLFLTKPVKRDELLRAMGYLQQSDGPRIFSQRA